MDINWESIQQLLTDYGIRILSAIAIFIIGRWISKIVTKMVVQVMTKANLDITLVRFLKNIIYTGLLMFVVIAVLNKLGVSTTSAVAVIGAAGLAIALSLQSSLSNLAAGVMMVIFRPFLVGDFIKAGDIAGKVDDINIFYSQLSGPDNVKITVPNNQIMTSAITNFTNIKQRRVDLVFGISYDDDVKKAKDILMNLAKSNEFVLSEPEPLVAVDSLGNSSVNIICRPWTTPDKYWDVYRGLLEQGKLELEKAGMTIPYPQQDVHLYNKSA